MFCAVFRLSVPTLCPLHHHTDDYLPNFNIDPNQQFTGVNLYESPDGSREQRMAAYIFKVRSQSSITSLVVAACMCARE